MAPKKWYAVRKGHRTGIFESWDDCKEAIDGFSGAQYKSFKSAADAQAYLTGSTTSAAPAAAGGATAAGASAQRRNAAAAADRKFYAVARGRQVGIFESWPQAEAMVAGYTNPVHKSFKTRQEAENFLAQHSSGSGSSKAYGTVRGPDGEAAGAAAKRQRGDSYQAAAAPPAFNAQQQQQQQAAGGQALSAGVPPQYPAVTITFDGGSRNNPGRAGYGYAVWERKRNDKVRMGCRPLLYGSTNNEAEYSGLIAGMRYSLEKLGAKHIVARGDSQLVVRQMTGEYKCNGPRLLPLLREAKQLEARCESFQIEHIYREENALADELSNLAMDSDAAVDKVVQRWSQGAGRAELAVLLAAGAQVDHDHSMINALRTAPCFMQAAAQLLAHIWDSMAVDEVTANLAARGWDGGTGGPPVDPLPQEAQDANAGNAAAAAGAGAGASGVVAAAVAAMTGAAAGGSGRGVGCSSSSSRGMQAVPVAPVTLGKGWAQEIRKQEALMQQQQQQQRGGGGAGGGQAAAAAVPQPQHCRAAGGVSKLLGYSIGSGATAASLAVAGFAAAEPAAHLQLQRYRQRRLWPYSDAAVASMPQPVSSQAELARPGRVRGMQLQQQRQQQQHLVGRLTQSSSSVLMRSSSGGSLRMRAGRVLTAAAAAAAGRLYRREAGSSSSSDSSRRQRGFRGMTL